MRWIVCIIIKDLKVLSCPSREVGTERCNSHHVMQPFVKTDLRAAQIGVSVESAMRWLHPDAGDMWKMTMSLSDVVRACADPSKRLPRQACPLCDVLWV